MFNNEAVAIEAAMAGILIAIARWIDISDILGFGDNVLSSCKSNSISYRRL